MLIDPTLYKHYSILQEMSAALAYDYQIIQYRDPMEFALNVYELEYPDAAEVQNNWWGIYISFLNEIDSTTSFFPETKKVAARLPGVYQQVINFVKPHGTVPMHGDTGTWGRIRAQIPSASGYTIAMGINTLQPSNFELQGLRFAQNPAEQITFGNNEIIAFEGLAEHEFWNNTDAWHVCSILDIDIGEWNVAG